MKLVATLRKVCAAGVIMAVTAGCSSSSADGPTSPPSPSITASASVIDPSSVSPSSSDLESPTPSVADPSTTAASSTDPGAQEAADRAAIEAQWIRFWKVYAEIARTPESERASILDEVSASPQKEKLLEAAAKANADGIDNYGEVKHRIYWQVPVGNQLNAVIADCQDQSQSGQIEVASGKILSTGVAAIDLRGRLIKGSDGIWRVQEIINLGRTTC